MKGTQKRKKRSKARFLRMMKETPSDQYCDSDDDCMQQYGDISNRTNASKGIILHLIEY